MNNKNRYLTQAIYRMFLGAVLVTATFLFAQPASAHHLVTLTKPVGGGCIKSGDPIPIEWTANNLPGDGFFHLALVSEDGSKWKVFADRLGLALRSYPWTAPAVSQIKSWGLDPNKVKMEVVLWRERDVPGGGLPYQKIFFDRALAQITEELDKNSSGTFRIATNCAATPTPTPTATQPAGALTLVKPNGGECLKPGSTTTIEWQVTATPANGYFHLALISADLSKWKVFFESPNFNMRSYQWTVPTKATVQGWNLDPSSVKVEIVFWEERDTIHYRKIFVERALAQIRTLFASDRSNTTFKIDDTCATTSPTPRPTPATGTPTQPGQGGFGGFIGRVNDGLTNLTDDIGAFLGFGGDEAEERARRKSRDEQPTTCPWWRSIFGRCAPEEIVCPLWEWIFGQCPPPSDRDEGDEGDEGEEDEDDRDVCILIFPPPPGCEDGSSRGGTGTSAEDTTPPTAPRNLRTTSRTTSTVGLAWTASSDSGSGVAGYRVFRDDTLIASTASTAFTDRGLTSNTSYRYFVRAIDKKGNISSNSNTVTVTTKDSFFGEIRVGPGGE